MTKFYFVCSDIFSALSDPTACKYLKEVLVKLVKEKCPNAEIIVGLESRGFLFNFLVATELGIGCAPVRKKGKLPGDLISVEYVLEYGKVRRMFVMIFNNFLLNYCFFIIGHF